MKQKLSVFIITLNEEKNIERCLKSVASVADEIVVVDSLSTDKTKDICLKYNAIFYEQKFLGFIEQKSFAMSKTSHEMVLALDADEALDEELAKEVLAIKEQQSFDGYEFKRLTNYNGCWIRHSGWYPDVKMRLASKHKAKYIGTNPHDILAVEGKVKRLEGNLLHYSYDSISSHILQTNKFSTIEARTLYSRGKRATLLKLVTRPPFQFFKDYILKKGFLDGRYGFIICLINSLYVLLKYAKMMDMELDKKV